MFAVSPVNAVVSEDVVPIPTPIPEVNAPVLNLKSVPVALDEVPKISPITSSFLAGSVVPIPTFPATANPFVEVAVDVEYPITAPPFTCSFDPGVVVPIPTLPNGDKIIFPEVAVDNVKSPLVFAQLDVPPDIKVMAPVVLPISTVLPPVPAKVVLPETVNPPVPWMSPDPELTPTPTIAPVLDTLN